MYDDIVITDLEKDPTGRFDRDEIFHPANLVEECFDDLWEEVSRRFELETGDITPLQDWRERRIKTELAELVLDFIKQNRSE